MMSAPNIVALTAPARALPTAHAATKGLEHQASLIPASLTSPAAPPAP